MSSYNLGRFRHDGRVFIGRPQGEHIEIISRADDLRRVLADCDATTPALGTVPAGATTRLAPLDPDARVFAIAVNYQAHGAEAKSTPPSRPLMFYKPPSNFVAPGTALRVNRKLITKLDYEGEIGIVIGRTCKDATLENALDHVVGICAFNDGSARNFSRVPLGHAADAPTWPDWTAGKAHDAVSALGPTITCGTEALSALRARTLRVKTLLNGEVVQDESMAEMIFSCEQQIVALSSYMELRPGDVIATGTPAGVGLARGRFLQAGDRLEVQVTGTEPLTVNVE